MRALMKGFDLAACKMDIRRSFTEAKWAHVLVCLDTLPVEPQRLRLKAFVHAGSEGIPH